MEYSIWTYICLYSGLAVFVLIFMAPFFLLASKMIKSMKEGVAKQREERNLYKLSVHENGGVLAPAVIKSARRVRAWNFGGRKGHTPYHLVDFEVEVKPESGLPFRTKFQDELYREHYTVRNYQMVNEIDKKVWVMYDPKEPARAFLDHYDEDHKQLGLNERELNVRRIKFDASTQANEVLKKNGEQAEAIITRVEDLNLTYPQKQGRAMHIYFDVTPKIGSVFQSEGNFLIGDSAIEKYSVGKKVYVRFDPLNPKNAALDSERNKLIQ